MKNEDALRVIETKLACLSRDLELCSLDTCITCDYFVGRDLKEALQVAAKVLREVVDAELPEKDGFECVRNVRASKQLAWHLKPYRGCPRGSMGPPGNTSAVELLRNAKQYVIAGRDDRFVCIPEWDYEACLKALENGPEAEEK